MALLKKTNDLWQPSEKPNLQIGETVEMTDYVGLVKSGMAVLVDDSGNELELPGQIFTCPICFETMDGVMKLTEHLSTHLKKNKQVLEEKVVSQKVAEKIAKEIVEAKTEVVKEDKTPAEITRAKRLAALEKARAARKIKK